MTVTEQAAHAEALRDLVYSVHILTEVFETPDTSPDADSYIARAAGALTTAFAFLDEAVDCLNDEAQS